MQLHEFATWDRRALQKCVAAAANRACSKISYCAGHYADCVPLVPNQLEVTDPGPAGNLASGLHYQAESLVPD